MVNIRGRTQFLLKIGTILDMHIMAIYALIIQPNVKAFPFVVNIDSGRIFVIVIKKFFLRKLDNIPQIRHIGGGQEHKIRKKLTLHMYNVVHAF